MSRSIHQTFRAVFLGKSKAEIQRMIDDDDADVVELLRKRGFKRRARDHRELAAFVAELDDDGTRRTAR